MPQIFTAGLRSARYLRILPLLACLFVLHAFVSTSAYAQFGSRDRIIEPVDNSRFTVTSGHLRPALKAGTDLGALPADTTLGRVTMFFSRSPQQDADLQSLLAQLQDHNSVNYHRWLTPEEYAARFGLSQGDVDRIVAWLQSQGLTVQEVSRSRTWVAFGGTTQQIQAALQTELRRYAVGGETHFMVSREPSVPSALAGVVLGFHGLDDFRMKPQGVKLVAPRFTSGQTQNHFLAPGDVATLYNLSPLYSAGAGIDGSNQKIVVVGQTAINISDVHTFRSLSGLPVNDPQILLVPLGSTDPGLIAGDIDEANLDLDWVGAVARKATIQYVYANPNTSNGVIGALFYAIDQNLAPVISISYGLCEGGTSGFTQSAANILASEAQKANVQGITIVAPSGDNGAADCDAGVPAQQGLAVDLPGALPYVTSVGGTRFSGDATNSSSFWSAATIGTDLVYSALSYISETSWNDTGQPGVIGPASTGGGSSIYFAKPSWQTGTGVPADGARDIPDVSFSASGLHDGYLVCSRDASTNSPTCVNGFRLANGKANGNLTVFGGTSAGVPIFAGLVALINQQTASAGQGNVNPKLYAMAAASPSNFHDITSGNNTMSYQTASTTLPNCTQTGSVALGYLAGTGYDLVTGLGSINAYNLVTNWTSVNAPAAGADVSANFQLSVTPASLTVKHGACGSVSLVLTRTKGFAGTPVFTCTIAAPLTAATCVVSPVASSTAPPVNQAPPVVRWWPVAVVATSLCFAVLAIFGRRHARDRGAPGGWISWAPGFAATCLLALTLGCGGGGSSSSTSSSSSTTSAVVPTSSYVFTVDAPASTTVGSAAVTVTGTIGGVSHSTQLTLAVN